MPGERRKFTTAQKVDILSKANQLGVMRVLKEHNISYSVFSRWRHQLSSDDPGIAGEVLQQELKLLQEENRRLKKIIGTMALELEMKQEEIKKIQSQKRGRESP